MKIVMIGAGSAFGSRLSVDILSRPALQNSTICLCDISEERLDTVRRYVQKVIDSNKLPATLEASADRRDVLADADIVVLSVSIGGPAYYGHPFEAEMQIPEKYGPFQTVGDTIGPGGIFRALRTGPELQRILADIAELAPESWILNYTNPMAMLTWLIDEEIPNPVVGLCHSVQGTARRLAQYIGIDHEQVSHWVAGINHMAWFLSFRRHGENLYPRLRRASEDPSIRQRDSVRFEVMDHFGYFVTESSRHFCEYVPWYQHEQKRMTPFREITAGIKERRHAWIEDMGISADAAESVELIQSHEYASAIIEARLTNAAFRFNGNVSNRDLISNLPKDCCVEVPCMVDAEGIHPCAVGELPAPLAGLCRSNVTVQELTVRAMQERSRELAWQATLLDPLVGATMSVAQARGMFEELWEAEGELLADYPATSTPVSATS